MQGAGTAILFLPPFSPTSARFPLRHFLLDDAYIGGVRPEEVPSRVKSAAARFLSQDPAAFAAIPGFQILYRSPPELVYDSYRIYRLQ